MNILFQVLLLFHITAFGVSGLHAYQDQDQISEITLERTRCYGPCPAYKVILRRDGTAIYIGKANVEQMGTYKGTIHRYHFDRLTDLLRSHGYLELNEKYARTITDQASVVTSVLFGNKRKTVVNYADSGPVRLWEIEMVIDAVATQVKWEKERS